VPDRLAARLIDVIACGVVVLALSQALGGLTPAAATVGTVGFLAYCILLRKRGTIGRRALSLRVIGRDGDPVTAWQVAARNAWVLPPFLLVVMWGSPTAIANLVPLNLVVFAVLAVSTWRHPDHVGPHDRLAGTMVVRAPRT
jgi:uncharacterized RDD family membrane protein YckC